MLSSMPKRTNHTEADRDTITPAEAAQIAKLTPSYLARLANRGRLTVSKPGGSHRRYLRAEIEALAAPVDSQGAIR